MNGKRIQIVAIGFILSMLLCMAGCNTENDTDKTVTKEQGKAAVTEENQQSETSEKMGRYVEKTVSLPGSFEREQYMGFALSEDQLPVVYVLEGEGFEVAKYNLKEDGTWTKEILNWTGTIPAQKHVVQKKILCDAEGNEYLYYTTQYKKSGSVHVYRKENEKASEIAIEGWDTLKAEELPENVDMLANGTLTAILDPSCLNAYDITSGKLLTSAECEHGLMYDICGNDLIFSAVNRKTQVTTLFTYTSTAMDDEPAVCEYPGKEDLFTLCQNSKGNYVILDESVKEWDQSLKTCNELLPKEKTVLFSGKYGMYKVCSDEKDNYYTIAVGDQIQLFCYQFDSSVPAEAQYHLNVHCLFDNPALRDAIVSFQQNHPEYELNYTKQFDYYNGVSEVEIKDYIRALNTQMLAGHGPDIFDLTGLPAEDYIRNGALCDITEVIQANLDKGTLFENIVSAVKKDEKYYAIPLYFKPVCVFGPKELMEKNTIRELTEFAKSRPKDGRTIFGTPDLYTLIDTFLPVCYDNIVKDDLTVSEENLKSFVEDILQLYEISEGQEYEEKRYHGGNDAEDLPYRSFCYIDPIDNYLQLNDPIGFCESANYEFGSYHQYFESMYPIGIYSQSPDLEAAKEFLMFLLSDEFNTRFVDTNTGMNEAAFSINKAAYEQQKEYRFKVDHFTRNVTDLDGERKKLTLNVLTDDAKEQFTRICNECSQVYTRREDVCNIMIDGLSDYLSGKEELDAALNKIQNTLSIYVAE